MVRTVVGVLRGGTSGEYNLSLKTGAEIMRALPEEQYDVHDILIDKEGYWHSRGLRSTPARALTQLDVVLNALHGGIGEDGTVQRILERTGVPYAGSRALAAAGALNKIRARTILQESGVRMPEALAFTLRDSADTGEMSRHVFARFGPPYIVKPPNDGAGRGIRTASSVVDLPNALADVLDAYGAALVEEYVRGEEASVGLIEGFRGEELYALPPAHVMKEGLHLGPEHHESGKLRHLTPSTFSYGQKQTLADTARMAHKALGLMHYSRSDLIVTRHGVYLLEVNSTPGLYAGASFPHMLEAVGSTVTEFLEHAIQLARSTR